jgi:hypothetical protein
MYRSVEDTKEALKRALERAVCIEQENESLRFNIENLLRDKGVIENTLENTRRYLNETEHLVRAREGNVAIEDFAKLVEKLEISELRAQEASTESAKAFANSSRTIAYLESECTRLKTLIDHFRCVNVKLSDDVKLAHLEGKPPP